MLPPVFYAHDESYQDGIFTLDKAESHHLISVMRISPPAIVMVINGRGGAWRGEVVEAKKNKHVKIKVHSEIRNFGETAVRLTLAAGLSTNYKFDSIVQKGTELGVIRFIPLMTYKSKVKVEDPKKALSKVRRLEKVAMASIKQCRRSYLPEISTPMNFDEYLNQVDKNDLNLIFHPGKNSRYLDSLDFKKSTQRVNLLVGAESGFSDDEIEAAMQKNFQLISLGNRILRTENAAPTVTALVMFLLNELR